MPVAVGHEATALHRGCILTSQNLEELPHFSPERWRLNGEGCKSEWVVICACISLD